MRKQLVDYSPGDGIYRGDLVYGRCNGTTPVMHKDFSSDGRNKPIAPLVLVEKRDPEIWSKDPELKDKKKLEPDDFEYVKVHLVGRYVQNHDRLRSNIHLVVGKTRL